MGLFKNIKKTIKKLLCSTAVFAVLFSSAGLAQASGPVFGAEKEIFRGMNITKNQQDWTDPVTGNPGDEFRGLVYVHNNVVDTTATNTRVRVTIPSTTTDTKAVLNATVSADNAASISDTLTVDLTGDANIEFLPGTAKLFKVDDNNNPVEIPFPNGQSGNEIVTANGVNLDGLQGCFQFVKYVSFGFKTKPKEVPEKKPCLHISKLVRNVSMNEANFVEANEAKAGDILEYKVDFSNTGDGTAFNVRLRDVIPQGTQFISGSATLSRDGGAEQMISDDYVGSGIVLDRFDPRETGTIKFRVKVHPDCKEKTTLVNTAFINEISDTATTVVKEKPVTPVVKVTPKEEAKPLPVSGPATIVSIALSLLGAGFYAYRRYKKYLLTTEAQVISELTR